MTILFDAPVTIPDQHANPDYQEVIFLSDPDKKGLITRRTFRVMPEAMEDLHVHTDVLSEAEILKRLTEIASTDDETVQPVSCICCDEHEERHGPFEEYYPTGIVMREGAFKNGKLDGVVKEYYPDGSLMRIGHFKDGKRHGEFISYYQGGTRIKQISNFDNGVPHGTLLRLDEDQNVVEHKEFDMGRLAKTIGRGRQIPESIYVPDALNSAWKLADKAGGETYLRCKYRTGALRIPQTDIPVETLYVAEL